MGGFTSHVPERSVLGLMLFNIFISDLGAKISCALLKSEGDSKLGSIINTKEDWIIMQEE